MVSVKFIKTFYCDNSFLKYYVYKLFYKKILTERSQEFTIFVLDPSVIWLKYMHFFSYEFHVFWRPKNELMIQMHPMLRNERAKVFAQYNIISHHLQVNDFTSTIITDVKVALHIDCFETLVKQLCGIFGLQAIFVEVTDFLLHICASCSRHMDNSEYRSCLKMHNQ